MTGPRIASILSSSTKGFREFNANVTIRFEMKIKPLTDPNSVMNGFNITPGPSRSS
jgi:hypothetical protein